MWCAEQAAEGGESLFVDGRALLNDLESEAPWAARALTAPNSVIFKSGSEYYQGPVFDRQKDGTLKIRLRLDHHGFFSTDTIMALAKLREGIIRRAWTHLLPAGQGYVIDNWQILHGRRSFSGYREMLRILVA
jgi:hypothetical protein